MRQIKIFICEDCKATFTAVRARFCPACRHIRLVENARRIKLNQQGVEALERKRAEKQKHIDDIMFS